MLLQWKCGSFHFHRQSKRSSKSTYVLQWEKKKLPSAFMQVNNSSIEVGLLPRKLPPISISMEVDRKGEVIVMWWTLRFFFLQKKTKGNGTRKSKKICTMAVVGEFFSFFFCFSVSLKTTRPSCRYFSLSLVSHAVFKAAEV